MGIDKALIKEIIKRLHQGVSVDEIVDQYRDEISGVTPAEISKVEQELIGEGMPLSEIRKFCDIHLTLFRESLKQKRLDLPHWHPLYLLTEEHNRLLELAGELKSISDRGDFGTNLKVIIDKIKESEKHYLREENVLFPYLERHGVSQPPKIMWMEHDQIREIEKEIFARVDERNTAGFKESALKLADMLSSHFFKENNILFPTGLDVITSKEWLAIRNEFDDIGYMSFSPKPEEAPEDKEGPRELKEEGLIDLETGMMAREEVVAVLNSLPVDITFVDKDDRVRYFSQTRDRIFVRTKAVLGREVQKCHPEKSVYIVNKILEDFRAGKRDVAQFWLNLKGRLIYIRYFPVRDEKGKYLGCLEVTQDITEIKNIEGEKRLLD
ncbi:MAG TPA: DUF438 domain-containing protein [bacterium (Candidatus Stahlbacteria)]|nr:DUF438 domain-containing protein [Candidatus Stahlbacteria bacterium]